MPARRPEVELLLCCARTVRDPGTVGRIGALLGEGLDWEYLLRAAHDHRMAPLLYWHLSETNSDAVPEDTLGKLRDHFRANRLHNLFLTGELLRLLKALESHGIPAVPYKGPTLATVAYGDLAFREFSDLDILIRERDVLRAREVVTSLGYRPQYQMSRAQQATFLRYLRQYVFTRDDDSTVELHWTVAPKYISFSLDFTYVWERTERVPLCGGTVSTFSAEDLLLTLCVHGSVHRWERLGWICDVAELVRVSEGVDWQQLLKRANVLNSKRMLLLGLFLANDLLGTDLADNVLREIEADPVVYALARGVRERLFSETPASWGLLDSSAFRRFHFQIIERLQDKLWYCLHRVLTPTLRGEWKLLPLPAALYPCYRLLRPVLLAGRFGRKLARQFL